jgi:hypothetical protein
MASFAQDLSMSAKNKHQLSEGQCLESCCNNQYLNASFPAQVDQGSSYSEQQFVANQWSPAQYMDQDLAYHEQQLVNTEWAPYGGMTSYHPYPEQQLAFTSWPLAPDMDQSGPHPTEQLVVTERAPYPTMVPDSSYQEQQFVTNNWPPACHMDQNTVHTEQQFLTTASAPYAFMVPESALCDLQPATSNWTTPLQDSDTQSPLSYGTEQCLDADLAASIVADMHSNAEPSGARYFLPIVQPHLQVGTPESDLGSCNETQVATAPEQVDSESDAECVMTGELFISAML